MSKTIKNTRRKRGGQMLMDFNSVIIPYYSPITSKGGTKHKRKFKKNKSNKSRTRRQR